MQPRLIAVAALVPMLAAATACGGSSLGRDGAADDRLVRAGGTSAAPDSVPASAVRALELDAAKVSRRGTFRAGGVSHALFVGPSAKGTTCVLDVSESHVGAGCSPSLFGSHELAWTEGFEGGPGVATITALRVAGVASARVDGVAVELADGRRDPAQLTPGRAFMYQAVPEDVHAGVLPVGLLALDSAGHVRDRVELPGPQTVG
jgi:hypothetical protein